MTKKTLFQQGKDGNGKNQLLAATLPSHSHLCCCFDFSSFFFGRLVESHLNFSLSYNILPVETFIAFEDSTCVSCFVLSVEHF